MLTICTTAPEGQGGIEPPSSDFRLSLYFYQGISLMLRRADSIRARAHHNTYDLNVTSLNGRATGLHQHNQGMSIPV